MKCPAGMERKDPRHLRVAGVLCCGPALVCGAAWEKRVETGTISIYNGAAQG